MKVVKSTEYDDILMNLGDTLREIRIENGLTQREVGQGAHIRQANISLVEAGKVDIKLLTLERLVVPYGYRLNLVLEKI